MNWGILRKVQLKWAAERRRMKNFGAAEAKFVKLWNIS
ncbi:hypothetical protein CL3_23370 [butyrate-producing bacterium SM4/1]|nr:hypothetical protein CL3_23370 [butyrate-producing bacterium SM4/1]